LERSVERNIQEQEILQPGRLFGKIDLHLTRSDLDRILVEKSSEFLQRTAKVFICMDLVFVDEQLYNVPRKLDSSIRWQRDPGPW